MNHFQPPRNDRPPKNWAGSGGSKRVRFELTEALTSGGTAAAKIRIYDRVGSEITTREIPVLVHDAEEVHSGQIGDFGRAEWMPDAQRWEVYVMQLDPDPETPGEHLATKIRFALPGELTQDDAGIADAQVLEYWGGAGGDPGETVTLENYPIKETDKHRWHGEEDAVGLAELYNAATDPPTYRIYELECPEA